MNRNESTIIEKHIHQLPLIDSIRYVVDYNEKTLTIIVDGKIVHCLHGVKAISDYVSCVKLINHESFTDHEKAVCKGLKAINSSIDLVNIVTRKREIVEARQIAQWYMKKFTNNSDSSTGAFLGGKDHATIIHSAKTIDNLIDTDKDVRDKVAKFIKHARNGYKTEA